MGTLSMSYKFPQMPLDSRINLLSAMKCSAFLSTTVKYEGRRRMEIKSFISLSNHLVCTVDSILRTSCVVFLAEFSYNSRVRAHCLTYKNIVVIGFLICFYKIS